MKKQFWRRLRAALSQMLLAEQLWAIHEPALASLVGTLSGALPVPGNRGEFSTRLGMHNADPPTTQMLGQTAVLPIVGVLQQKPSWVTRVMGWTSTEILERDFRAAVADSQVRAIILYCDSPGGQAVGNEEVSRVIHSARGTKPIYAFVRGMCASAAYYLGSAAKQVVASPSSTVGSIGAMTIHAEFTKALEEMGIGVTLIRHGERKALWNSVEKLTPTAKASLQKWISDYGTQFETAVARHRGVELADVRARFGQGDVFLAAEAKERGLIDAVASWEQLLAKVQTAHSPLPQPGQRSDRVVVSGARLAESVVASFADGTLEPGWEALAGDFTSPTVAAFESTEPIASALPASASAGTDSDPSPAASAAAEQETPMKITPKVRAALFARGLIASFEASDDACQAALDGFFTALTGKLAPSEEAAQLAGLNDPASLKQTAPAANATPTNPPAAGAAANVQQAHDRELAEARAAAAADERQRSADIRASAALLNMPQAAIDEAIAGGKPHAEVVAAWHAQLARREPPVSGGGGDPRVTGTGDERYMADAQLAILLHLGQDVPAADASRVTPHVQQLSRAPLRYHAEQCLRMAGVRFDPYDTEEMCRLALGMGGTERVNIGMEGPAFNRPGNFPNLLSGLVNKILDGGLEMADVTYPEYTGLWPQDLPDFKPAPVVAKGTVGELDEVLDAEAFKELGLSEEMLSYMQLARFGNKVGLTPVLVANDDLNAFMENLLGLSEGWELTVNRLCLRQVTGNVALLDGFNLYDDTNHGNDVTAGGVPSVTEWEKMQLKVAAQQTVGNTAFIRARLRIALVPPAHEVVAQQTFLPFRDVGESKQPATDSNLNVYRGRVNVVVEPELQDASSDVWYGFCDPRRFGQAAIVRAYFRGFGRRGRRERWYDPNTKCWYVSLEGRVGAAAKQYRTTVRNDGTA